MNTYWLRDLATVDGKWEIFEHIQSIDIKATYTHIFDIEAYKGGL